ncbi:hypothetical protein BTI44_09155, partial [Lactobacillus delbrueckii subsp. bulgaricus]|nr:hypothetical protein [Lactobacillus delbrueckii subsp. bulgaricus]
IELQEELKKFYRFLIMSFPLIKVIARGMVWIIFYQLFQFLTISRKMIILKTLQNLWGELMIGSNY